MVEHCMSYLIVRVVENVTARNCTRVYSSATEFGTKIRKKLNELVINEINININFTYTSHPDLV